MSLSVSTTDLATEFTALMAKLEELEASLPAPRPCPRLHVIHGTNGTQLPCFYASDPHIFTFQDASLRALFFQYHHGDMDEDALTPVGEVELASMEHLSACDAVFASLRKPTKMLHPKQATPPASAQLFRFK